MVYLFSKLIIWPILRLFIKKIEGVENLPNKQFIMVANHGSYIDALLLIILVAWYKNKQLCFFATKDRFMGPIWSIVFDHFGAIRVNGSIEKARKALRQGKCLGLFPEGQRTFTGKIQKATHKGLGIIALLSKAPIVPVGLNTYKFWNRKQLLPNLKTNIKITIGKPMKFKGKTSQAKKVVKTVMKEVSRLARISNT